MPSSFIAKGKKIITYVNSPVECFIHFSTCDRTPQSTLKCDKFIPELIPLDCANGLCSLCRLSELKLFECPILNAQTSLIKCNEWYLAPRAGTKLSREQNTQLELGSFKFTLPETLDNLHSFLTSAIKHQVELRWKSHCLKLDATGSDPKTTVVFATDFGTTLDLMAKQTENCSTNHYAVARMLYAIHRWELVEHECEDNNDNFLIKTKRVSKCDRWVSFIDAISKVKKMTT